MVTIDEYPLAVAACFLAMICWGSWQNTTNLAGKLLGRPWRFELYYWDFVTGILLAALAYALTFGSTGGEGRSFAADLSQASPASIGSAMLGGGIWNLGTLLLVAAIAIAGMSVAFPIGGGIGWLLGILVNYLANPVGNAAWLFAGMAVVAVAILLCMKAYGLLAEGQSRPPLKGILLSVAAGLLIAFFFRFTAAALDRPDAPEAGRLTPYTALVFFALGAWVSTLLLNPLFMRRPVEGAAVTWSDYAAAPAGVHLLGLAGGGIWVTGMMLALLASHVAGDAISYGLSNAAPMVAAAWGVLVWGEFAEAPPTARRFLGGMFALYLVGLILLVTARLA